jgi:uncharacterized protein with ATP-grasp and redox domains
MDLGQSPAVMGEKIHRLIRELTGSQDPYRQVKKRCNRLAMGMYGELSERIRSAEDPMGAAVRLAIAGNTIDFGVNSELGDEHIAQAIWESLTGELDEGALDEFREAISRAEEVLYIGDNAGEIVFDKLLIEQLPREKITFVVKSGPIINDATMEDAEAVGLRDVVKVIESGSAYPGTILGTCSEQLHERFDAADAVIAKGQGNYETLCDLKKDIFFLLKVKCKIIARDAGVKMGDAVLMRNENGVNCAKK